MIGAWYDPRSWVEAGADVVSSAVDRAAAAFDAIPGASWAKSFVKTATGPVGDFARSEVGQVVLRAIATTMTGGLAPILGPQLATVAWAVPGLAAGDSFTDAWLNEFQWRLKETSEIAGADIGRLLGEQVTRVLGDEAFRAAVQAGKSVAELARHFGIREDAAALAIDALRSVVEQYRREWFPDAATGKRVALAGRLSAAELLRQRTSVGRYLNPVNADAIGRSMMTARVSIFGDKPKPPAPAPAAPVYRGAGPVDQGMPAWQIAALAVGGVALVGGAAWYASRR